MDPNFRILAIIPARGGSKRLSRKNLLPIGNKFLIDYSIEAALKCPLINTTVVSSEDPQIILHAKRENVFIIPRPDCLATDEISNDYVAMHVIKYLEEKNQFFDIILLLQPTSPLRTADHLTECLNEFIKGSWQSAMSVFEIKDHPAKALVIQDNKIEPFLDEADVETQSQKLPKIYCQNGAIYITRIDSFKKYQKFFQRPCMPYIMTREDSIDIDSEFDLQIAKMRLQHDYSYV